MMTRAVISVHLSALIKFKRQLHEVHKIGEKWSGHFCTNGTSPLRIN